MIEWDEIIGSGSATGIATVKQKKCAGKTEKRCTSPSHYR
jgi:hypothetical protein